MQDFFNWTMTYRRDSDIYAPYFTFEELKVKMDEEQWQNVCFICFIFMISYLKLTSEMIKTKNTTAAWIVSNCGSYSHRLEYVKRLEKFIKIDIYGQCGTLKCDEQVCRELLQRRYW
jgi:alpha-1,3-fucosyltransferase